MMNRFLLLLASAFILPLFRADAQCLPKISCDTLQPFCDVSDNDAAFWNAAPCWSQLFQSHDLPEGAVPLRFAAYDTCGTATVGFTLYLDLNGDGFQETAVQHSNLLTGGRLMFNNATQPGMISGDTILFDARSVSDDLRFHFALKTEHAGDSLFASVVWENADTTVAVQFPFNQHRMVWWTEQDNERDSCIQDLKIRDCEPPVVSCIPGGLTVGLLPTCMLTIWASDFIAYTSDNYEPGHPYVAVRKVGDGTGFPIDPLTGNPQTSVTYSGCELGIQNVEVWAKDFSGNISMCETYILVTDNNGNCDCFDYSIVGSTCVSFLPQGDCVEYAEVTAEATYQNGDTLNLTNVSNTSSPFTFLLPIGPPAKVVITPYHNDDPLNGVSTYDAVLMQKHILNLEPLNSPYKMIAADINRSGSITTFDIVLMRRVLLGIDQNFFNNTSWRFVPRAHVFPTANPFDPPAFPETITLYNVQFHSFGNDFYAIKVGDVNNTSITLSAQDDRSPLAFSLDDRWLNAGETIDVPVFFSENADWIALQGSLDFNPEKLDIEAITAENLPAFDDKNWAVSQSGLLNLTWNDIQAQHLRQGQSAFTLRLRAKSSGRLSDALTAAQRGLHSEGYSDNGTARAWALQYRQTIPTATRVLGAQPNPTRSNARLTVELAAATPIQLDVFDAAGRLTYSIQQTLSAGLQMLNIPASALPASGVYTWRVRAGEVIEAGKLVAE